MHRYFVQAFLNITVANPVFTMRPSTFTQGREPSSGAEAGAEKPWLRDGAPPPGREQGFQEPEAARDVGDADLNNIENFFNEYLSPADAEDLEVSNRRTERRNSPHPARANVPIVTNQVSGSVASERAERLRRTPMNDSPFVDTGKRLLPERRSDARFTVVLDLDNTLIHATRHRCECDFVIDVEYQRNPYTYYVSKRPYADELLQYLQAHNEFEVVFFTAAKKPYGRAIVDHLLADVKAACGPLDALFLSSEHTTVTEEGKIKDLACLGRELETIAILEDNPVSYRYQRRNSFPLSHWERHLRDDAELSRFVETLETIRCGARTVVEALDEYKINNLTDEAFQQVLGDEGATN